MKFKTPLILLAVLLVLGGIATWDDWRTEKKSEEEKTSKSLTDLTLAGIETITYHDSGANTDDDDLLLGGDKAQSNKGTGAETNKTDEIDEIKVEKIAGKWRVTAPLETNADAETVEDFIKTVLDYQYDRVIVDSSEPSEQQSVDLKEYGLDKPARTITLTGRAVANTDEDGKDNHDDDDKAAGKQGETKSLTLHIGNKTPVGYAVYFGTADENNKVYVGSQYILTSTTKSLFSFRDKTLIAIDSDSVQSISFWHRDKKNGYMVVRQDGKFQLQKPEAFKTSQKKVREFIDEFNRVRVEKFFDAPDSELQAKFTDTESLTMTTVFELSTGETKSLSFVRDRGDLLVAFDASKAVFKLPALFEETINNLSSNFRDHSIFTFNSADIEQVEVDGKVYRLVKGKWHTDADQGDTADTDADEHDKHAKVYDKIQALLDGWETAEALGFVGESEVGAITAKGAAHKIELTLSGTNESSKQNSDEQAQQSRKLSVSIWQQDDKYYLKHGDSEHLYIIAKSIIESIATPVTPILTTE